MSIGPADSSTSQVKYDKRFVSARARAVNQSSSRATAISTALTVAVTKTVQLALVSQRLKVASAATASASASAYCCANSMGALWVSSAANFGAEARSLSACSMG